MWTPFFEQYLCKCKSTECQCSSPPVLTKCQGTFEATKNQLLDVPGSVAVLYGIGLGDVDNCVGDSNCQRWEVFGDSLLSQLLPFFVNWICNIQPATIADIATLNPKSLTSYI